MTTEEPKELSPHTMRAYAGDWALFTDWCTTTGHRELPADPDTVTRFLGDCSAAPSTLRRRVAAIDHHHTVRGFGENSGFIATVAIMLLIAATLFLVFKRKKWL